MKLEDKTRNGRLGFLFFASRRFKDLGQGTPSGTYAVRVDNEREKFHNALKDQLEIIDPGAVYDADDLSRSLQTFQEKQVDCLLVIFMSWAEDNIWIRFLRDSDQKLPMIYYYPAKENIPFQSCDKEDDFIEFLASGGLVGMLVGSGSIAKYKRNAKVIVGPIRERGSEIIDYVKMCSLRTILHRSRFGIMPAYNEIMWNTYVDPYEFYKFGPELTFLSYDQLDAISEKIPLAAVHRFKDDLLSKYPVDPDVQETKFLASLRYSLGLSQIIEEHDLDVLTINDVDMRLFEKIGLRPGFYPKEVNKRLSVLCPEADLGVALSLYILKLITRDQVNIVEPFYADESRGIFAGGHAGPNDYSYRQSTGHVRISTDTRFAKTSYKYAGAPFAWLRIPPGIMTMIHISQIDGTLKMVVSLVESIEGPLFINSYTHSEFKPVHCGLDEFIQKLITIGTTQHFAVAHGDQRSSLRDLAHICGFEFYEV